MTGRRRTAQPPALVLSHVADFCRRYPGEMVTLFTRVEVTKPMSGFKLGIAIPKGLTPGDSSASRNFGDGLPELVFSDGAWYLLWKLARKLQPGEQYEFQLEATIAPTDQDRILESRAKVMPLEGRGTSRESSASSETLSIAISTKGRYLRYLPAIYTEQDELMGRFLMLFESFWAPIEQQIDQIHYYFDPKLTPRDLLSWLATWVDLVLDEGWSDEQRRILLSRMVPLYRRRGTKRGLQEYLRIYTGRQAQITEHRAYDLQLGAARLGTSIALGRQNVPHTFTVTLRLPPAEDEARRKERRRKIETIIESEKPVHTSYTLKIIETT